MKRCVRRWCGLLLMLLVIAPAVAGVSSQSAADLRGVARAGGRPSTDTVVWLGAPSVLAPASPPCALLDQRNLSFSPKVLVVRAGTLVDFPNKDRVFHNVFSFRDGKRFDLGLYPVGHDAARRLRSSRPEPRVLQHSSEHGGVRHDRGLALLRAIGRGRGVHDRRCPCRSA